MANQENDKQTTAEHLKRYIDLKYKLFKYRAMGGVARFGASLSRSVITYLVLILFIVFASTAIALCIGESCGNYAIGFAVLAGFYLVAFAIITMARKSLKARLLNFFIKEMFEKNEYESK